MDSRIHNSASSTAGSSSQEDAGNSVMFPRGSRTAKCCLHICPTTGGQFELQLSHDDTIERLKRIVGARLKIPKEKISLLYRERLLTTGSLIENGLQNQSKITLLPNVESGLVSTKPDRGVMQALDSLSDSQVNEFLVGKSPLTLAMRLGEHMMFVQLQLSTSPPSGNVRHSTSHRRVRSGDSRQYAPSSSSSSSSSSADILTPPPSPPSSPLSSPSSSPSSSPPSSPSSTSSSLSSSPSSSPPDFRAAFGKRFPPFERHGGVSVSARSDVRERHPCMSDSGTCPGCSDGTPKSRDAKHNDRFDSFTPAWPHSHGTPADLTEDKSAGAIIESMQHIGKGVYSGTFSGTLNPALQDQHGRPKRSINTIIHILNDLLGARPQCRSRVAASPRRVQRLPASRLREARSQMIQENRATRGKMQQLQAMMQQRRDRRRVRRDARFSPYSTPSASASTPYTCSPPTTSDLEVPSTVDAPEHVSDAVLYADLMSDNEAEIAPGACVV